MYNKLDKNIAKQIEELRYKGYVSPYRCNDDEVIRRDVSRDKASLWRSAFVRDTEKIIHSPYYNRYNDKTQVFSFYRNDDITRRGLHVQLVARISRNIGRVLGLNEDLIEAIALGHDIGHTPFGHAGERFLNEIYHEYTGRYFNHNVHSVRVLDGMFHRNISLQVLDGIICHNGEFEMQEYRPSNLKEFDKFDSMVEACYVDQQNIGKLIPSTLEGCVVRICDMVAYLGKDRQDAQSARFLTDDSIFTTNMMGTKNAEIINNITVSIINNSFDKDYILLDEDIYNDLKTAKKENYKYIYLNKRIDGMYHDSIKPMFRLMYDRLRENLIHKDMESMVYKHHIEFVNRQRSFYGANNYEKEDIDQIVVDYIASMTDDYFVDLFEQLFPDSKYKIKYISYFEN